ncbi:MAG: leucine-rich repeat protein, partial [Candidatus Methanomethylophilaceae archaeon]|nr:leucine-rich repeat protein [Candidatus Methanomethylophilaceae archaeon]
VVGFDSFRDCSRLSSVTFGNSTRDIEAGAFEGCSLLRSVVIPESVTKIEDGAFPRSTRIIREGEAPKTGFFKKLIGN